MDDIYDRRFTLKEYKCLLKMAKKDPQTWDSLKTLVEVDDDALNVMLSRLSPLFYVVDDKPITEGEYKLNQIGETIAQAEKERRFELLFNRLISGAALVLSIVSIIVSIVAL